MKTQGGYETNKEYDNYELQDNEDSESIYNTLENKIIPAYYKKDENLPDKPNVILIFTEGLSQNVISDEREKPFSNMKRIMRGYDKFIKITPSDIELPSNVRARIEQQKNKDYICFFDISHKISFSLWYAGGCLV